MINVLYCNINEMRNADIDMYLQVLPGFMRGDVKRYKYNNDQKLSLIARLMLYRSISEEGRAELLYNWKRDSNNKPYIDGWKNFNIAHSGKMVVFSCGSEPVGIDIEQKVPVGYWGLMEYFHPEEQDFITKSRNSQTAFYTIWTKKEALLKAIGVGLVDRLERFNCTGGSIRCSENNWYLYELHLHQGYSAYLCSPEKENEISIKRFFPGQLFG